MRATIHTSLGLAMLLMSVPDGHAGARVAPGKEGKLTIPGSEHHCVIYVPGDYQQGKKMPAVFFLHGGGREPSTWPFKEATGGKGYLVVGLSYGGLPGGSKDRRQLTPDPEGNLMMIEFIDSVRATVNGIYSLDDDQVFLAGHALGGFGVNYYGFHERAKGRYAGICIMAASPQKFSSADFSAAKGVPVLVVNGEKCRRLDEARKHIPILKEAGVKAEHVVIPSEGAQPKDSAWYKPLKAWLDKNTVSGMTFTLFAKLEAALADNKYGQVLRLLRLVRSSPGARSDAAKLRQLIARAEEVAVQAEAEMKAAEAHAQAKRLDEAIVALDAIAKKYKGSAVEQTARARITGLKKSPAADEKEDAAHAERALENARKLVVEKQHKRALGVLASIVTRYPDTPAAEKAKVEIERLRKVIASGNVARVDPVEKECRAMLRSARNFIVNGMKEQGIAKLDKLIDKYPDTKWAKQAKAMKKSAE